jgi:DNA polymerase-3 subunit delta
VVHLLFGDDTFTVQETLSLMKEKVWTADLRDVNTTVLDGDQVSLDLLVATCDTVPFLAEKRMVIVQGLLSLFERRVPSQARGGGGRQQPPSMGEWKALPEYLSRVPESTDLVFVEGRLSATNTLLAAIRPHVKVRTFTVPRYEELRRWIRARAVANGVEIESRAVDTLAEAIGGDLRVIAVELEKLSLYRRGQPIRHQDVLELVSYTKEANIFAAVDAIMEGRPDTALELVHQLLQSGRPPSYVLGMVARQVRLLILAKELRAQGVAPAEQSKPLGVSGYPLRKTQEQEKRFSGRRLVEIHRRLLEADVSIKTTGVDEELVLDVLIAEVSSTPARQVRRPAPRRSR